MISILEPGFHTSCSTFTCHPDYFPSPQHLNRKSYGIIPPQPQIYGDPDIYITFMWSYTYTPSPSFHHLGFSGHNLFRTMSI